MARIKIENIIDHLDIDIRKALAATIETHFPDSDFNDRDVFKTFVKMVGRKCSSWEDVPDQYIEK